VAEKLSTYRPKSTKIEANAYHRAVRYMAGKTGWTIPEIEHVLFMFAEYLTDTVLEGNLIEYPHLGVFAPYPHKRKRLLKITEKSCFLMFKPHPILRRMMQTAKHPTDEVVKRAKAYTYPSPNKDRVNANIKRGAEYLRELPPVNISQNGNDKSVGASLKKVRDKLHARMLRSAD